MSEAKHILRHIGLNVVANVLQALLAMTLIPLATRFLGPQEYGIYGLAMVVVGLMMGLCETGSIYVLYAYHGPHESLQRREVLSTLLCLAAFLGIFSAIVLAVSWKVVEYFYDSLEFLSRTEIILTCLLLPLRMLWSILNPILIIQSKSHWLAAAVMAQALISFVVVVMDLYHFGTGREALFWGQLSGTLGMVGLGLCVVLPTALARPRLAWLRQVVTKAPSAWLVSVVENLRSAVEGGMISSQSGSAALGLYNHARLYQSLLLQGSNAVATVIWPVALQEARSVDGRFTRIGQAWDILYAVISLAGLIFVHYGERIVALLTNGKFNAAAAWIPFLIIVLLLQNSGKPATAVLLSANRGNSYSAARMISLALACLLLALFVPVYGIPAAIAALLVESLVFRGIIHYLARSVRPFPFQDQGVVLGIAVILVGWGIEHLHPLGELERLAALLCLALPVAAVTCLRVVRMAHYAELNGLPGLVRR